MKIEDRLPQHLQDGLRAMETLSDDALRAIASSRLKVADRKELESLNMSARNQPLSDADAGRQNVLLNKFDEILIRRSHGAILLKERGYDISDPSQFNPDITS